MKVLTFWSFKNLILNSFGSRWYRFSISTVLKLYFTLSQIFRSPVPNLDLGYLMVERKYTCKLGAVVGTDASDCEVLGSIPLSTNYLFPDNNLLSWIFHFSSLKLNCYWWQAASQGSNHGAAISVDSNWMTKEWSNQSSTKQGHHMGCSYSIPTKILCFTSLPFLANMCLMCRICPW